LESRGFIAKQAVNDLYCLVKRAAAITGRWKWYTETCVFSLLVTSSNAKFQSAVGNVIDSERLLCE
jgi:hypothetical protein